MENDKSNSSVSLTDQILDHFEAALLETGEFDEAFVTDLIALARAVPKPKSKDIEKLLEKEEPLS